MPRSLTRRRGRQTTQLISLHKDDTAKASPSDTRQDQRAPEKELPKPWSAQDGATKAEEPMRRNCQGLRDTKKEAHTLLVHQEGAAEAREPLAKSSQGAKGTPSY